MAEILNPYAAPRARLDGAPPGSASDYWREGKELVMRIDGSLPGRCVKCNEPAIQPMKERSLYWHHPAIFLLFFINVIIYAVVALIVRKNAKVSFGLCEKHRQRRRIFLAIGWGGLALGIGAFFLAMSTDQGDLIAVSVLAILVCIIVGAIGSRTAYPSRITKEEVRLRGCGAAFLDSLESR